ncbi:MAG: hypothetical protein IPM80_09595 [Proteobacteria bacterium]|jgi:hypothetical protein|nr:hypothetical protein [Pseudomonadota bacterium]
MDDLVDELCAAARRHESALHALREPGHRATPDEVQRLEHKLECCEQWLKLIHADDALERSRRGAVRPSIRVTARLPAPTDLPVQHNDKSRVRRAS